MKLRIFILYYRKTKGNSVFMRKNIDIRNEKTIMYLEQLQAKTGLNASKLVCNAIELLVYDMYNKEKYLADVNTFITKPIDKAIVVSKHIVE